MNLTTNIYIDVDGVLIDTKNQLPAIGVRSFIEFITMNFNCYWLTTHCRGGVNKALDYLGNYLDPKTLELTKRIRTTDWDTLKTEAIDMDIPFYWLDDQPFEAEKAVLQKQNLLDSLIIVDLNRENELERIHSILAAQ